MKIELTLKEASIDDAERLNRLINRAYRGQEGWTRETEIVDGNRSSVEDLKALMQKPHSHMLVATINETLAACICIEENENRAYFGTFAVDPAFQNQGLGKQVLKLAENHAVNQLGYNQLMMVVISQREELISFYERRGYERTGKLSEYPINLNVGVPAVEGLTIECLEKITTSRSSTFRPCGTPPDRFSGAVRLQTGRLTSALCGRQ